MKKNKLKAVSAMLVLSLFMTSCTKDETTTEEVLTPVKVVSAKNGNIVNDLEYTGKIEANVTSNIISPIVAKVETTYFEVGDTVKKGDVLFKLDSESIDDQVKQLAQQVELAKIGVRSAKNAQSSITGSQYDNAVTQMESGIDATKDQIATAKNSVEVAKAGVNAAQKAYDMTKGGYNQTVKAYDAAKAGLASGLSTEAEVAVAKASMDQAEVAMLQAKAALEQAKSGEKQAESGVTSLEKSVKTQQKTLNTQTTEGVSESQKAANLGVEQAETSLETAQLAYDTAKKSLKNTKVTSPIDGVVSMKAVNKGDYATNQSLSYQVIDESKMVANVSVSEKIVNHLKVGDTVNVVIPTLEDAKYQALIKTIAPSADQTNSFTVKLEMQGDITEIFPGMFAKFSFVLEKGEDKIVVPREVVLENEDEVFVYVLNEENKTVEKRLVELGIDNGEKVQITSGLTENDKVISEGQTYVSEGDEVRVIE